MSTDTGTGEALIATYFTERVAEARAAAEKANAALSVAEFQHAAFRGRRELPPALGGMKQGWEIAAWATERATAIASKAIDGKATREDYDQAKQERAAVFAWLEANGYEIPAAYRG